MKPEEIHAYFSSERISRDASGQVPYTLNRILAEIAFQLAAINESLELLSAVHSETNIDDVTVRKDYEKLEEPTPNVEPPSVEPQHKRRGRPPLNRK